MNTWDDMQIHAYVDGELDPQSAARLEADSRADAGLAARIARQRELRLQLHSAFDAVLDEPVPQRLRDAVGDGAPQAQVIALDSARRARMPARPAWSPREWGAMAATLVLGTVLGAMLFRTPGALPLETVQGQLLARGELDAALSTQPGGAVPAAGTTGIGLSLRAADGSWCRTFSLRSGSAGLACRRQDRWAVQLLEDRGAGQADATGGFRQAESSLSPALLGAIDALGGSDALTPEQEQEQLRRGWKPATP
jgi:hypothetical protein